MEGGTSTRVAEIEVSSREAFDPFLLILSRLKKFLTNARGSLMKSFIYFNKF